MEKYNLSAIAHIVESEGMGYSISDYLGWQQIEDEELALLWKQCSELMWKIDAILRPYYYE